MVKADKQADLAGPGVSTYEEVAKILPSDYAPLQSPMERMEALYLVIRLLNQKSLWLVVVLLALPQPTFRFKP